MTSHTLFNTLRHRLSPKTALLLLVTLTLLIAAMKAANAHMSSADYRAYKIYDTLAHGSTSEQDCAAHLGADTHYFFAKQRCLDYPGADMITDIILGQPIVECFRASETTKTCFAGRTQWSMPSNETLFDIWAALMQQDQI